MKDTLSRRGRNAGISSSAHHRNQGYPSLPNQDFYIGRCRRACRAVRRRISNGDVCLGNAVWGCVNKWENRARCQAGKRSEERRVGKEGRRRGGAWLDKRTL